jgi:hypothetical protein
MQTEIVHVEESGDTSTGIEATEAQLTSRICELWRVHVKANIAIGETREGLKRIRIQLSRRLHELKGILSRPGRGGEWSAFLASSGIPRSTADRLVRAHEGTLTPKSENCTTGATDEPIEATIQRQVRTLWPRMSQVLTTRESVEMFITEFRAIAERSIAVDTDNLSSAHEALVSEPGVGDRRGEGVPPTLSSMTASANPAEQENQILAVTQAAALVHGSTLAQPAHFSSPFLKGTDGGNTLNHAQRSRARARLRSCRRKEELAFELGF